MKNTNKHQYTDTLAPLHNARAKTRKTVRSIFFLCGLIPMLLGQFSCKKFVEIPPPITSPTAGTVFENAGTATGAQLNIYQAMYNNYNSYDISSKFGGMADELTSYSSGYNKPYYLNAVLPNYVQPAQWAIPYNYIYQSNAVIEGLAASKTIPASIKNQLTGEALFTRALWHFYLTGWFGNIPLVTSTDYRVNGIAGRTQQQIVYQQIVTDLQSANALLNANYVDQTDTAITTDRIRPNAVAALALLARVYLFEQDCVNAEAVSTKVISNSLYTLEPDLNNVFQATSREAIWQLAPPTGNTGQVTNNTLDGYEYILIAAPGTADNNSSTISPQLIDSFEPGDHRKTSWIGTYTDTTVSPAVNYNFPFKYKVYQSLDISEYTVVLRLAEQYLIRAEARAQQGETGGALADLNTIRHRAGLGDYAGATDKTSLLAAILHERQVELFTEWGHRWMDLVRTKNVNAVMKVVTPQKGATWKADGHQALLPIPLSEIQKDNKLTQNPGY